MHVFQNILRAIECFVNIEDQEDWEDQYQTKRTRAVAISAENSGHVK